MSCRSLRLRGNRDMTSRSDISNSSTFLLQQDLGSKSTLSFLNSFKYNILDTSFKVVHFETAFHKPKTWTISFKLIPSGVYHTCITRYTFLPESHLLSMNCTAIFCSHAERTCLIQFSVAGQLSEGFVI